MQLHSAMDYSYDCTVTSQQDNLTQLTAKHTGQNKERYSPIVYAAKPLQAIIAS